MQTVDQVRKEIEQRMFMTCEKRASPAYGPQKEKLITELRDIAARKKTGEPIPSEFKERFSEIVTELHLEYGMSLTSMVPIAGINRQHLSNYIRRGSGEKKYFDESLLKKPEDKESLLAELRQIAERKIQGKYIQPEDRMRFTQIVTMLNKAHGVSMNQIADTAQMDRNIVASYMHVYTGPEIKRELPFKPGKDEAKKLWYKKSGYTYRQIWGFAQEITEVTPITSKSDVRKIAVEAVNYLNADDKVKKPLLDYIELDAFNTLQNASTYRKYVQIPIAFIQWLSEPQQKGYEIAIKDLDRESERNPKGITKSTGDRFVQAYVPEKSGVRSSTSQSHVTAALIRFFKFLEIEAKIDKYPLLGMKTAMERKVDAVVYNVPELDELFNKIISGKPIYFSLFMRLLLQTGSRPDQIFPIKCRDLEEFPAPVKDALGRDFYRISTLKILQEEKASRQEKISKKFVPDTAFIASRLRNDLMAWCKTNNLTGNDYIFKKFIDLASITTGISRRARALSGYKQVADKWIEDKTRMKQLTHDWDFYYLYGLRHTWASVVFFIPLSEPQAKEYVRTAGGWASGSNVPTDVYAKYMGRPDALAVAEKYEIYIDPKFKDDVESIRKKKEEAEKPAGLIGAEEIKKLWDQLEQDRIEREALRKEIQELKKK